MRRDIFIFSNGRVKRKDNTLYIENEEGAKTPVPIEQVENIHIFGQTDWNTSLLTLLTQKNVLVHFYNYYGYYNGSFIPREQHPSGHVKVHQSKHYLNKEKRLLLAKHFVDSAAFHMVRMCRKRGITEGDHLQQVITLHKQLPEMNSVSQVMGVEGMIRQHYYRLLNDMVPSDFMFAERTKRPPRDPFNALISFGNQLMYSTILGEMYKTQLDPTISYLHEPSTKRFSLSLDVAEIFKPLFVDPLLLTLVNKKQLTTKHFSDDEGIVHLNEEGKKIFIAAFDDKLSETVKHRRLKRNVSYRYLIRLECYKLIKHVIGDMAYTPLKAWW